MSQLSHLFFMGLPQQSARARDRGPVRSLATPCDEGASSEQQEFFRWLFARAGLVVEHYRTRSLIRRLPACFRFLGVRDVQQALMRLEDRPGLVPAAMNVVLLGVTEFCRDPAVFEVCRTTVLQELLKQHQHPRIWSAACSEGHELYSIAMALADEGRLEDCELLGTDCRADAIKRAREAVFPSVALAPLDANWRDRYFHPNAAKARLKPQLRDSVRWEVSDLFHFIQAGPWHMILWRNMAIYLNPPAADAIWRKLVNELHPGGFLITGKAEHPPSGLPLERIAGCIYRRHVMAE